MVCLTVALALICLPLPWSTDLRLKVHLKDKPSAGFAATSQDSSASWPIA
jgi:hypothetical protein